MQIWKKEFIIVDLKLTIAKNYIWINNPSYYHF